MRILCLFLSLVISSYSFAGASFTGTINKVVCHTTGISQNCQIQVNGAISSQICGTSSWRFTFDGSTNEGKNILSILLASQVSKQTITLGGTGQCSFSLTSEDLRHAYITTN
jgi:hypothetical protein